MNANKTPRSSRVGTPAAVSTLVFTAAIATLSIAATRSDEGAAKIEGTRTSLEQWVETRRAISKEKRDWELGRELLTQRIELVEREVSTMRDRTNETRLSIAEAERKQAELTAERGRVTDAIAGLEASLSGLEKRTLELLSRCPEPIRERVEPLSRSIPEESNPTAMTASRRLQNVVGILNEVDKFQREITVTSELRNLPDGTSAEVAVMYVGLGQAYYVDRNARIGGIGTSSGSSWTWSAANEAAPDIARAIAILKNEQGAEFVRLPIRIE